MGVRLERATNDDAKSIFDIQVKAFMPLLEKYKDYNTNPANESIDRVLTRINKDNGGFYKTLVDRALVGAICIFWKILSRSSGIGVGKGRENRVVKGFIAHLIFIDFAQFFT